MNTNYSIPSRAGNLLRYCRVASQRNLNAIANRNVRQLTLAAVVALTLVCGNTLPAAIPSLRVVEANNLTRPPQLQTPALPANGKIAFMGAGIYVMNDDGGNQTSITDGGWAASREPAWSPDGSKIVFTLNSQIYVMNSDGANQIRLTNHLGYDSSPSWSPDGSKIAFSSRRSIDFNVAQIYVMNADGSNQTSLTNYQTFPQDQERVAPAWSPDGSKIAFATFERLVDGGISVPGDIYVMNANGSNQINLTGSEHHDDAPTWSPDGTKIGFARQPSFVPVDDVDGGDLNQFEIYVMNADGSNPTRLTNNSKQDFDPAWSPDGTKIAFASTRDGNPLDHPEIYVMNTDGSSQIRLTHNPDNSNFAPSWQAAPPPAGNPIDDSTFFVRQHYFDFLNRVPDAAGYLAWQAVLNECPPGDTACDRLHVSSAFFRSSEFQGRGYFVYRFYPVAFGRKPDYQEFHPELAKLSGFLGDSELESAKQVFVAEFMSRPAFGIKFNGLSNTQYVDTLLATAGIIHPARDFWIAALGNGTRTRAQVLREIAESTEVYNKYYNQAFVVMQYFGYLHRQPDALYLNWLAHLEATGDYRSMIDGFVSSLEYRSRFAP